MNNLDLQSRISEFYKNEKVIFQFKNINIVQTHKRRYIDSIGYISNIYVNLKKSNDTILKHRITTYKEFKKFWSNRFVLILELFFEFDNISMNFPIHKERVFSEFENIDDLTTKTKLFDCLSEDSNNIQLFDVLDRQLHDNDRVMFYDFKTHQSSIGIVRLVKRFNNKTRMVTSALEITNLFTNDISYMYNTKGVILIDSNLLNSILLKKLSYTK